MSVQAEEAKVWCGPGQDARASFSLETNIHFRTNLLWLLILCKIDFSNSKEKMIRYKLSSAWHENTSFFLPGMSPPTMFCRERASYFFPHLSYVVNVRWMCTSILVFCFLLIFHEHENIFNKYVWELISTRHYSKLWNTVESILGVYILESTKWVFYTPLCIFLILMMLCRIPGKDIDEDSLRLLNILCKYIRKELDLQNYFKVTQPIFLRVGTDIDPSHKLHPLHQHDGMGALPGPLAGTLSWASAFEFSSISIQVPPKWPWARIRCF